MASSTLERRYQSAALVSTTARVRTIPATNLFPSNSANAARPTSTILQMRDSRYRSTLAGSFESGHKAKASRCLGRFDSNDSNLIRISSIKVTTDFFICVPARYDPGCDSTRSPMRIPQAKGMRRPFPKGFFDRPDFDIWVLHRKPLTHTVGFWRDYEQS